jgi:hypothetical protein
MTAVDRLRLPLLTDEVVLVEVPAAPLAPIVPLAEATLAPTLPYVGPAFDEVALTERLLAALQPQVERLLEARLREALLPALARLEETLQREARAGIARALRDMVAGAVAQEIDAARRR